MKIGVNKSMLFELSEFIDFGQARINTHFFKQFCLPGLDGNFLCPFLSRKKDWFIKDFTKDLKNFFHNHLHTSALLKSEASDCEIKSGIAFKKMEVQKLDLSDRRTVCPSYHFFSIISISDFISRPD